MDLATFKADGDWQEALAYAGKDAGWAGKRQAPAPVGDNPPSSKPFGMADVAEIIAAEPGENDGPNWICALKLTDGRYAYIEAWCDYTGWDCQADGTAWVASDLPNLIRYALTEPARDRLKLPLMPRTKPSPPRNLFDRLKQR